jgi:AAA+ superfamily predicted ATPase
LDHNIKPGHTIAMLDHYPNWAREFARKYFSKTINQFVLHGNVRDYVQYSPAGKPEYLRMRNFLSDELFGGRDIVLYYDRASGVQFRDKASMSDFNRAVSGYDTLMGTEYAGKMPKDPVRVFTLMENYFRMRVADGKSIAVIIDYTETIVPVNEGGSASAEDRNALVYLLRWSHDPMFLNADFSLVMMTENLSDLNRQLVQNPYTTALRVELPSIEERSNFIRAYGSEEEFNAFCTVPMEVLAQQTAGLSFVNLQAVMASAKENKQPITFDSLIRNKKELIEAEAYGLLEFVQTRFNLDYVAGHAKVKRHLREAANALKQGRGDVLPMGYLVCGPVGTGKTFIVTCFASEVGVPMVKLKNFRSQWQGVTEGNLEKILNLLTAMAPVAVMIDEADAYLGDRNASGDSGVSSRVFAQIAQFMSNTENRGRIMWFLMTARPDLMPVDLKRQGRAEEHLALFPPSTEEERIELYTAMKKKTGLATDSDEIPELLKKGVVRFSGADMEAALTRAKFRAASLGLPNVTLDVLNYTFSDFLPPNYPEEVELQTLCAVMECTSKDLLPEEYRDLDRSELSMRIEELKMLIGQ